MKFIAIALPFSSLKKLFALCSITAATANYAAPKVFPIPVPSGNKQAMWNLNELSKAPRTYDLNTKNALLQASDGLKPVFYDGVPYEGKNTRVFAWIGVPEHKPGDKVPGIVLVHGGGGTAFKYWAKLWLQRGYAVIAMDTCGCTPAQINPRNKLPKGVTHKDGGPRGWGDFANVSKPVKDQWMYHAVAAVVLGNSLLRSLPEVDSKRVGMTGISWGGIIAEIAAGVDNRFAFVAPVYGCGFLGEDSHWQENNFQKMAPADVYKWLKLWDPSQYVGFAGMPMLFVDGTNDKHFRPGSWQKTYNSAKGDVNISMQLRMRHAHPPAGDPKEITVFADSIAKGTPPLPKIVSQLRNGKNVSIKYVTKVPIKKATLLYTKDSGPWRTRRWLTKEAELNSSENSASAVLPEKVQAYYFNITDNRNCVVSSKHVNSGS